MTATDIVNFYIQNPPFEVADTIKYTQIVNQATQQTLLELSENDPIVEEKRFTTPESQDGSDYVLVDIYETIHPNFMSFIVLTPTDRVPEYLAPYVPSTILKSGSLLDILSVRDGLHLIQEATARYIQKIIFGGRKIKLKANTEYYCLFNRYRTLEEIGQADLLLFQQLLELNIFLYSYQSSLFTAEQGIRSVSISGLSVSLNVPTTESVTKALQMKKQEILSQQALNDYTGLIGHF
jgi:hypothetical protein